MQQFRPLPKFNEIEEAEPVEMPLAPTTNPIPMPTMTLTNKQPATPHYTTGHMPVTPTHTSGHMPVVLLSGPSPTPDTDKLAAFVEKAASTNKHPSLTAALQTAMGVGASSAPSRLVVIPGARKRKKAATRRLNPRLRQTFVFLATLVILIVSLTTLVPLSDSQNGGNIFSNIGNWIHSAQIDWNLQAHQGSMDQAPTALNGPGLPYMAIANSPYVAVAEKAAADAGIPPVYFVRQIQQESGFNPNAVSVTNAQGIAQFEPYTASGLGINPWDPNSALPGAARLMASYYHRYGNYAKALGAYNAGSGSVQSAVYACGMNWLSCMPGQTQNYVYRIMGV